jgi:hypothetical protein
LDRRHRYSGHRTRQHAIRDGLGCPCNFQLIDIEAHGEQRTVGEVQEVSSRHVSRLDAAAGDDAFASVPQRPHDDLRLRGIDCPTRHQRIQNAVAFGQHLKALNAAVHAFE